MKRTGLFCCLLSLLFISGCATNHSVCSHSFGAWQKVGDCQYSAKVEFCVYPKEERGETEENDVQYGVHGTYGSHVMDNMIKLLNGESFTEQMALNGDAEKAEGTALETWRETEQYQETLEKYSEAVSFSYTNNLSSFICVEIFVLNDKDFAEEVFEKVKTVVPEYVEKNMPVPAGYGGTKCVCVSENDELTQKYFYERICETCGFVDKKRVFVAAT